MSIILPNLDDREFADMVAEAKGMIPQLAPSWTDHNPSDPGITLIELFVFISEMLMYRTNRVTEANKRVFLQLLMGKGWLVDPKRATLSMDQLITTAIAELRKEERAITNADFERFALDAGKPSDKGDGSIARAYCMAKRNYESVPENANAIGHVSLVIIPRIDPFNSDLVTRPNGLASIVSAYIEPRRLLTTQLHVVPAKYLAIGVTVTLAILDDYRWEEVQNGALIKLDKFFHPIDGSGDGQGWKPGQSVYAADIYALLDQLPGVDFVEPIAGAMFKLDGNLSGGIEVTLHENQLFLFKKELSVLNPYQKDTPK